MTVYVDSPVWRLGRMIMCHMVADSVEELHEMAQSVGVARRWFQDAQSAQHYDVCKSKRDEAELVKASKAGTDGQR